MKIRGSTVHIKITDSSLKRKKWKLFKFDQIFHKSRVHNYKTFCENGTSKGWLVPELWPFIGPFDMVWTHSLWYLSLLNFVEVMYVYVKVWDHGSTSVPYLINFFFAYFCIKLKFVLVFSTLIWYMALWIQKSVPIFIKSYIISEKKH